MDIQKFLEENIVVDCHLDLLFDVEIQRKLGRKNVIVEDYFPRFKAGGINIVVSSLYIENEYIPEGALRKAMAQISCLYSEVEESNGEIIIIKEYNDILMAIQENKIGIMLSFEGIEPLQRDIRLLKTFYELGVRMVGINWSRGNSAADGCKYNDYNYIGYGLTEFGVELVKQAEELGMIIDVTHLNEKSFWDVLDISKNPVIASHSNCRSVSDTPRNLSDEQIKAICEKNGVICFNANSMLVSHNNIENANVLQYIKHIKYVKDTLGSSCIGFGFDLCDYILKYSLDIKIIEGAVFDTFNGYYDIKLILQNLHKQGFDLNDMQNLAGKNILRVFRTVLK
ncbi:MAG: dipeptidase [Dethiosulfatibacter sp.]|nr:dipeptidase [Dethiosulfatibacter sp.]